MLPNLARAPSNATPLFYRTTPRTHAPEDRDCVLAKSRYLYDVFKMCERGIWERDLRQFMPPASLRESLDSLLAMGLIECTDAPHPPQIQETSLFKKW